MAVAGVVIAAAGIALLLQRGGDDNDTVPALPAADAARAHPIPGETHVVAEAIVPSVAVHAAPRDGAEPVHVLTHPTDVGAPLVFLVAQERGEWLRVHLPVRPNGSTGWVRADDVRLSQHGFRIVVRLSEHRLELLEHGGLRFEAPVAVGTTDTPTPGGTFYVKELLKPPDPDTIYGNYAFGLSGFSNVLDDFAGGEGVIGIHGTNDPSAIGSDVSHGCIRLTNEDMLALVGTVPLGTPVEILP